MFALLRSSTTIGLSRPLPIAVLGLSVTNKPTILSHATYERAITVPRISLHNNRMIRRKTYGSVAFLTYLMSVPNSYVTLCCPLLHRSVWFQRPIPAEKLIKELPHNFCIDSCKSFRLVRIKMNLLPQTAPKLVNNCE